MFLHDAWKKLVSNWVLMVAGLVIIITISLLPVFQAKIYLQLETIVKDALIAQVESAPPSGQVVIVDIDEKSLEKIGQWPWPRYQFSQLLTKLQQYQVLSSGIDFLLSEPDKSSLSNLKTQLQENYSVNLNLQNIPQYLLNNDLLLAETLAQGSMVLSYSFLFEQYDEIKKDASNLHPISLIKMYEEGVFESATTAIEPNGLVSNLQIFQQNVDFSGYINVSPDHDGIIRQVPLLIQYQQQWYPNLSLATLLQALGTKQMVLKTLLDHSHQLIVEDRIIPLDKYFNFTIHYRDTSEQGFTYLSAYDVMSGNIPMENLAGKIVFLGTSAQGLKDIRATPFNSKIAGVEIHAHIIDNIIAGDFISRPGWALSAEISLWLLSGFIGIVIFILAGLYWNVLYLLLVLTGLVFSCLWLIQNGILLSPVTAIIGLIVNFALMSAIKFRLEEKKVLQHVQSLNKIQQGVIHMLQETKVELEDVSIDLESSVKQKTEQLNQAFEKIQKADRKIKDSLFYSSNIQRSLLVEHQEVKQWLPESFVYWSPRDVVSGDIYFFSQTENGLIISVIDCTGHGVPGALLTMLAVSGLKQIVINEGCEDPAIILGRLTFLIKTTLGQDKEKAVADDGLEMALCYIARDKKQVIYAGAGIEIYYILDNNIHSVKADRQKIGYKQSKKADINFKFKNNILNIEKPMTFYMSTDGFIDEVGGEKKLPFGKKRFKSLLLEIHRLPFEQQKELLSEAVMDYSMSNRQIDDQTIIGFKL